MAWVQLSWDRGSKTQHNIVHIERCTISMCLVAINLLNLLNNDAGSDKDDYDEVTDIDEVNDVTGAPVITFTTCGERDYCDDIDDCDVI